MKTTLKAFKTVIYIFTIACVISSCSKEEPADLNEIDANVESTNLKAQDDCTPTSYYNTNKFRSELTKKFLTVNTDGSTRYSIGNYTVQEFTVHQVNNSKYYAIKGKNGKWLSSEDGQKKATFTRDCVGEWEKFELVLAVDICYCKGSRTVIVIRDKKNGQVFNSETGMFDTPFANRSLKNVFETYY